MGFKTVRFFNYRNLRDGEVLVDAPEVFFIGENGQGKTNFLEAVYLLCFGSSFRTHNEQLLIRQGSDEMAVDGVYETEYSETRKINVRYVQSKKEIRMDEKIVKDRRELLETVPCIVFSHDDIQYINGAPETRRIFFNQTLILHDYSFLDILRTYNRILRSRNTALKHGRNELLDVYDIQLAETGHEIIKKRNRIILAFNDTFSETFSMISGVRSPVSIEYIPSWKTEDDEEKTIAFLKHKRHRDIVMSTTTSGPHRDKFLFRNEGCDFSKIASTGQLRLASLILKAAQARFYEERTGRRPVLLLDDVLLELDGERRKRFLSVLPEYEQAFFTFLPDEQYMGYGKEKTRVYKVNQGTFEQSR